MGRGRHAILSRSLADLFRNISFAILLRSDSAPDRAAQFRLRVPKQTPSGRFAMSARGPEADFAASF
jgi:hypothetical protein